MGRRAGGPVTCYSDRTFHTAILEVSKKVHDEAISILYGEAAWKLHIYLIFWGNQIHGSNVDSALEYLARSKHFPYIRTCILDVRLFRREEKDTIFRSNDALRANINIVRGILLRAHGLRNIEVSWRNYFILDPFGPRCRTLEPLVHFPTSYKLSIFKVNDSAEISRNHLSYWPDMLKAFRVMLFRGGYGDICVEERPAKSYWRERGD